MPSYHTVYVTKLGVPFVEEAQEFESEAGAALAAGDVFNSQRDEKGNYHSTPVAVTTVEGRTVILTEVDHITVMTPEELKRAQEQEKQAQLAAAQMDFGAGLDGSADE